MAITAILVDGAFYRAKLRRMEFISLAMLQML